MIEDIQNTCFIVSPIGKEHSDERKHADDLRDYIIKPACEELGFKVVRVDEINKSDKIDKTILECLSHAKLVVVDMTFFNPNVFYEFGYRYALNKHLIAMISEDHKTIPFDVSTLRTIFFNTTARGADKAKKQLQETIRNINFLEAPNYETVPVITSDSDVIQSENSLANLHDKVDMLLKLVDSRPLQWNSTINDIDDLPF
ncbi:hypothetical protein NHG28_06390 [Aerococcaceae bacterium NML201209]|nr:hypothetical protein [Aerococcaceae bacterium NML201209]